MKIPNRFKLFGQTITVRVNADKFSEDDDGVYGFASYRTNTIWIKPLDDEEMMEQVFWHELVHFIFNHTFDTVKKEEVVAESEHFVDLVSSLLHQAITTFEYDYSLEG